MKTTAQLLALHEQAQRIIAELSLTEAIRRDAAAIERLRAEAVEKRVMLPLIHPQAPGKLNLTNARIEELLSEQEPQALCGGCSRRIEFCVCEMWDHAPMTEGEHNRYPSGRYTHQ